MALPPLIRTLCAATLLLLTSCTATRSTNSQTSITVAAAANLTEVFEEIRTAFTADTGIDVVYSFAATTLLTQQITNSAPFDVFAAADTEHIDQLVKSSAVVPETRAVYARGVLALWAPHAAELNLHNLAGLTAANIRFIAIANPNVAPYGAAAVDSLKNAGVWQQVQPKLVYANNINQAKQLAVSGNADAAFTAYSLVFREQGLVAPVDPKLHQPIDQALAIVASSSKKTEAKQFTAFVLGAKGRAILARYGYQLP